MMRLRKLIYLLSIGLVLSVGGGYYFWHMYHMKSFSCKAMFIQHHQNETLSLWLNYVFEFDKGIVSINGSLKNTPESIIDRKIFFNFVKKGQVYLLTSYKNIRFPDDNVTDVFLEKYEPEFFIYKNKDIYIKIKEYDNDMYIFALGTLPTYACSQINN